jgi:protein-disulfide isomerase
MKRFVALSLTGSLGLLVLCSTACQAGPARAANPQSGSSGASVVATGDGVSITAADLEKAAAGSLARVRQQEYEIRKDVLDRLIGEALMAKEATARGISVEELLKKEVEDKVAPPTKEAVDTIYEQYKAQLRGQTREQAGPQIEKFMRDRDTGVRREAFRRELLDKAGVKVALEPPRTEVPIPANAPALGPSNAPVTIVAFTDYQCPYCHRAQNTIDQVLTQYSGKVRLVHQDFPLDGHAQAFPAARAARCAGEQGKFWEYYRSLMTATGDLSDTDLQGRADGLKLDPAAFKTCVASDRHDAAIKEGLESGTRLGVTGTPGYFINGRMVTGAQPLQQFQAVIDSELGGAASRAASAPAPAK